MSPYVTFFHNICIVENRQHQENVDYDLVLAIVLGIMWKQFFYKTSTINDLNNDVVEGE